METGTLLVLPQLLEEAMFLCQLLAREFIFTPVSSAQLQLFLPTVFHQCCLKGHHPQIVATPRAEYWMPLTNSSYD